MPHVICDFALLLATALKSAVTGNSAYIVVALLLGFVEEGKYHKVTFSDFSDLNLRDNWGPIVP